MNISAKPSLRFLILIFLFSKLYILYIGHLALSGSNSSHTQEFVEFEVKRALEWLQGDRNEAKRYSAVLVLKNYALVLQPYSTFSFHKVRSKLKKFTSFF